MENESFSAWLRRQLDRREWTQADFVRRTSFSPGMISGWITGKRLPSPASVEKIADVFGLPVDTVLTIAGHRPDVDELDPNDPRQLLAQRILRIDLREDDIAIMNYNLDAWEKRNKREREQKG